MAGGSYSISVVLGLAILAFTSIAYPSPVHTADSFQLAQVTSFSAWRPYSNPDRLISVGMNKGEVLAIAGKPAHEESYYQGAANRLTRISDWYYIRTGFDAQTTMLKFVQESLVSINTTATR
jgi:hypothetical protein